MTTPPDVRSAGALPPGSRASDYATSKYYLPPSAVPTDADTQTADGIDARTTDALAGAATDAGHPAYAAAYAPPQVPLAPVRRRRGGSPALGVALVLVLLAGVLGGGYWMLNRQGSSATASGTASATASGTASAPAAAAKRIVATPRRTAARAATPTLRTATATGGYALRPPRRHFVVRLPHRPTTTTVPLRYGSVTGSSLLMVDRRSRAEAQWTRISVPVPASQQAAVLRGMVSGLETGSQFAVLSTRDVTFHGHAARLVALKSPSGVRYTAVAAVYRPIHLLLILAPTGPTFDLVKNSFEWPI